MTERSHSLVAGSSSMARTRRRRLAAAIKGVDMNWWRGPGRTPASVKHTPWVQLPQIQTVCSTAILRIAQGEWPIIAAIWMDTLKTLIRTETAEFAQNRDRMAQLVEELKGRLAAARLGGG